ncbi:MAG: hypothetical protein ACSW8J_10645 [bacterium]
MDDVAVTPRSCRTGAIAPPDQLDETRTFAVTMDSGAVDIAFSPSAYAGSILKESNVDVNRVGVTAMYFCYRAAKDYRAAHNYS